MEVSKAENAGLYVHVPFCVRKCPYCDFYSVHDYSLKKDFISALMQEITSRRAEDMTFDSIYFGGGTPTTLEPEAIGQILECIRDNLRIAPDCEISLEANPGTVTLDSLVSLKELGFNRINLGVQSFDPEQLDFLGRIHTANQAVESLEAARQAGFSNVGLDLMFGLPGQEVDRWGVDLRRAVECEPTHISCYMLTYADGTEMEQKMREGRVIPIEDSAAADLFVFTIEFLEENGYPQYEISNFHLSNSPGDRSFICRHNMKYWTFAPYLGFGPAAHSFLDPQRWWNVADLPRYIDMLGERLLPEGGRETLHPHQKMLEHIYVGFRLKKGISLDDFRRTFSKELCGTFEKIVDELQERRLLRIKGGRAFLTIQGMLLHDSIVSALAGELAQGTS
jgi:oxygen-independent coproporphyrinogen-3 oxidase